MTKFNSHIYLQFILFCGIFLSKFKKVIKKFLQIIFITCKLMVYKYESNLDIQNLYVI